MLARLFAPSLLALVVCAGCPTQGSGVRIEEDREIEAFTELDVGGSLNVIVHAGAAPSARLVGDDNLVSMIKTELHGDELRVYVDGSYSTRNPLSVFLTTPALREIELSGSADVVADGLRADSLVLDVSGSGTLSASGHGAKMTADVSGSGQVDAAGLPVEEANVDVAGSGRVSLTATSSLRARVSGSGSVRYGGSPSEVDKDVSGSGSIRPL